MKALHDPIKRNSIAQRLKISGSKVNSPKILLSIMLAMYALVGCSPTVKIEPPDKPIVINLNVKIEHEIKIKVDKELDQLLANDELF
ncbi:hypothetical protein TUM4438_34260 [Shewanella sairae]|uniref:YnbE-like lipoprotein n=2 Tax=Shewanella sairae TaxID=190310 RepID=A0ABQ4PN36_9GAMM|nr:hypothetical protein TUM4438_34260 [Shewanella sairae]